MIVDRLVNAEKYFHLHPGLPTAFEFLRSANLSQMPLGKHEIDGDRLFAILARENGRGIERARLEAHRTYIDVQYDIAGGEIIGFRPTEECADIAEPYDSKRDICFFADKPHTWLSIPPGAFAIFFPEDAHAPLAGEGEIVKAIVKIAVEW